MVLKLHQSHLQTIRAHAESTYPNECCGIMLGSGENGKTLVEVWATENAWSAEADAFLDSELVTTKKRRYAIAAATLLQVQRGARVHHLDIIGIYHSHPDNCAIPSEFDRLCAWHQYSYIIVSVQQGKAGDLLCWSLNNDNRFQPEEILTV